MKNYLYVPAIDSTNVLMWKCIRELHVPDGFMIRTDFQTAGKGQQNNSWESEQGKNLLFSIALYPESILAERQFIISQVVSLSIVKVISRYTDGVCIKWPNDIYWKDKKLCGILIETSLMQQYIKSVVVGIGLNINQLHFCSDAPNPVSLRNIIGKTTARSVIAMQIREEILKGLENLDENSVRTDYVNRLYRKDGFFDYKSEEQHFKARIVQVQPDGRLELEKENGERSLFYFKEVTFCH